LVENKEVRIINLMILAKNALLATIAKMMFNFGQNLDLAGGAP
jgi:hypothetical protein